MNHNKISSARDTRDWKDKYLTELEKQEKRERQHLQMVELLVKAVVRISLVADGVDPQLDKQLSGLRNMLREGISSGRDLNTVVNALEGQVKRLDVVKGERAKVLVGAFQSLTSQLKGLSSDKEARQQLKRFSKNLKTRSARIHEYSVLINEFATLQQSVLADHGNQSSGRAFWQGWFSPSSDLEKNSSESLSANHKQSSDNQDVNEETDDSVINDEDNTSTKALDLSEDNPDDDFISDESTQKEPPFSRLSKAICSILSELLAQIEPPEMAKQNYNNAQKQIKKGLNWFELVPTLEDISIVVTSAFDSYQKEFEQFLLQLNQRLKDANQLISVSEQANDVRIEAGKQLSASVREQVNSIQQRVDSTIELDQLKSQVRTRLDNILATMDQHQSTQEQHDGALSEQLNALVDRVKAMEQDSENAEQRIEEHRQRALRDVLTQLPNREAYQQRLAQEFERWQRYQRPLSLIVCDIDHFKRVNDTYGHLSGDKVLRIIAKSLAKRLRKTDFIARFGGEEFVVLMPETEQQQALKVVDGVRSAIAACPFHFKDEPVSITLSFGISGFTTDDEPESVFARADKALYEAKDQGRNRCVLASL